MDFDEAAHVFVLITPVLSLAASGAVIRRLTVSASPRKITARIAICALFIQTKWLLMQESIH
jgi:hypothetical protein